MILLPVIVVAGYVYRPAVAAPILVVASIGLAIAVEFLARSVHRERTDARPRQVIGIIVALSLLAIIGSGVAILHTGNAPWTRMIQGAVAGSLIGWGILITSAYAEDRPRLAQGIVVLIALILLVAGAVAVGHLSGFTRAGSLATLVAGGFLGLLLVLGFFGVKEIF